jgi:hypothetical protein
LDEDEEKDRERAVGRQELGEFFPVQEEGMQLEVNEDENPDGDGQRDEKDPGKRSFHSERTPLTDLRQPARLSRAFPAFGRPGRQGQTYHTGPGLAKGFLQGTVLSGPPFPVPAKTRSPWRSIRHVAIFLELILNFR